MDSISVELVDAVDPLNASRVTAGQAASMDTAGPAQVVLDLGGADIALQSDDVLVGDVLGRLALLAGGSGKDRGEQSSEKESQTAEARHLV